MSQPLFTPEINPNTPPPPATGKAIAAVVLGALSLLLGCLTGVPAIIVGWMASSEIRRSGGKLGGKGLAATGIVLGALGTVMGCCVGLLTPPFLTYRETTLRMQSQNNLKQLGLGMHMYHDTYKSFPLRGSDDPELGINMSWRVRLLPYLEQLPIHDQIDYHQPWDGPANSTFHGQMPRTYAVPPARRDARETSYLVFTGPDDPRQPPRERGSPLFGFGANRGVGLRSIIDGTTNTIMIVEADRDRSVPWMKPADLVYDKQNPKAGLGNVRSGGFIVVMADGSTRFLPNTIDDEVLRRLIMRDDGKNVDF